LGLPIGLQYGAEVAVFSLVGVLAGRMGQQSLAAHQITLTLASFTFCGAVGIAQAGSVRVGWAVGAREPGGPRLAGLATLAVGGAYMALMALGLWLFPEALAGLFTDGPDLVAASVPVLMVAAVFQLSDGAQAVGVGILRGAGETRFPFLANLIGHYLIGLPVAIAIGLFWGGGITGLWWGLCAGLTAVAAALLTRFWRLTGRPIVPLARP
jgi:MATE family multidrug resistance protein